MKHYLIKIVVIFMIGLTIFKFTPAHAESASMSETYVAITDAKSTIADKDKSQSDKAKALKDVKKEIKALKINDSKEGKQVNSKLKEVENASSDDAKADKLGELTKALIAYENQQSSKDASGKIKGLQQAVDAKDAPMKKAIKDKNHTELQ